MWTNTDLVVLGLIDGLFLPEVSLTGLKKLLSLKIHVQKPTLGKCRYVGFLIWI